MRLHNSSEGRGLQQILRSSVVTRNLQLLLTEKTQERQAMPMPMFTKNALTYEGFLEIR